LCCCVDLSGLSGFDSVATADFVGLRGNSSPQAQTAPQSGKTFNPNYSYRVEAVRSASGRRSQLIRG